MGVRAYSFNSFLVGRLDHDAAILDRKRAEIDDEGQSGLTRIRTGDLRRVRALSVRLPGSTRESHDR